MVTPEEPTTATSLVQGGNNEPVRGIFAALPKSLDTPVFNVCTFSPSTNGTNARQQVACPVTPSAAAKSRLEQCQRNQCSLALAQFQDKTRSSLLGGDVRSWLKEGRSVPIMDSASQLTDCSLKHCISEFWAAYGSLCIALDSPVFRRNNIVLPRLPSSSADTSLAQLHRDYLASVRAQQSPSDSSNVSTKLGICAPIPPLGTPCDPMHTEYIGMAGLREGGLGIPNLDPMPKSAILSPSVPNGAPWPRVVQGNQTVNPVRLFFALPTELSSDGWNTGMSMNTFSLTACDANTKTLVASTNPGEQCTKADMCRMPICPLNPANGTGLCLATIIENRQQLTIDFIGIKPPSDPTTPMPPRSGPGASSSSWPKGRVNFSQLWFILLIVFAAGSLCTGAVKLWAKHKQAMKREEAKANRRPLPIGLWPQSHGGDPSQHPNETASSHNPHGFAAESSHGGPHRNETYPTLPRYTP